MSSIYDSRQRWKLGFIFAAVLIAMASVVVSDLLIKDLAREERQKIEVWSEATRVMTSENPSLNMNLILKIIQGNTSIPVILCSETDSVVSYNNIALTGNNIWRLTGSLRFVWTDVVQEPAEKPSVNVPICGWVNWNPRTRWKRHRL